jgi:hypothetical protein
MRLVEPLSPKHPTCLVVLGLVTDLEACLRELSQIPSGPGRRLPNFHQLIDEHRDKSTFSDYWGVHSARFIRNRISHRDPRPGAQPQSLPEVERAETTLDFALRDVLPLCSQKLQDEIGRDLAPDKAQSIPGLISVQSPPSQLPVTDRTGKAENVCPECGHQFKGNGFDGIDAHWRARHEAVMPYRDAWPLIKSGNYRRGVARRER